MRRKCWIARTDKKLIVYSMNMVPAHIENALINVEQSLNAVSVALLSGDAVVLEAYCSVLRQESIDFSVLLKEITLKNLGDECFKLRLTKIAAAIAFQRETLIRKSVLVDMALNTVVPATQCTTYAQVSSPYGSAGKQSGAFKNMAA